MTFKKIATFAIIVLAVLICSSCASDIWDGSDIIYLTGAETDNPEEYLVSTDKDTHAASLTSETAHITDETFESSVDSDGNNSVKYPEGSDHSDGEVTSFDSISSDTEHDVKTVYWVENGKVWHTTENCSSLSRSKNILSGTEDEAVIEGKERVCKRCG